MCKIDFFLLFRHSKDARPIDQYGIKELLYVNFGMLMSTAKSTMVATQIPYYEMNFI